MQRKRITPTATVDNIRGKLRYIFAWLRAILELENRFLAAVKDLSKVQHRSG